MVLSLFHSFFPSRFLGLASLVLVLSVLSGGVAELCLTVPPLLISCGLFFIWAFFWFTISGVLTVSSACAGTRARRGPSSVL
ncbi:hypothetical protein EI94DRAFT_1763307 [Lactarius quietus]|nr:hypothetical protein EI94DRAFT_1763307 [Lactarius quietus]